jgi:hypothetical protein
MPDALAFSTENQQPPRQGVGIADRSGAQRVEYGRDARRRDLRVIGEDRRKRVPVDFRTGGVMRLDMVRVQFHKPWNEEIVAEIHRMRIEAILVDVDDHAVFDHYGSGGFPIGQNDPPRGNGYVRGRFRGRGFLQHVGIRTFRACPVRIEAIRTRRTGSS